jgi:predicted O-methyltransferase YrrM
MFSFWNEIVKGKYQNKQWDAIESCRKMLLKNKSEIHVTDFGAGSKVMKGNKRKISDIAKYHLQSPKDGAFMARMIHHHSYKEILELGSSLGISTSYLASEQASVSTIEGCPNILKEAKSVWDKLDLKNIKTELGNIDDVLKDLVKSKEIDLCLIDANHSYNASMRYWELIEPVMKEGGAIVFDDIYWDSEMTRAWREICGLTKASLKLDFFHFGILVFNPKLSPQEYTIKYA